LEKGSQAEYLAGCLPYCNGEVYGYEVEQVTTCGDCGSEHAEHLDSCWGFYGLDYALSEAEAAVAG
jgi:hypothetical protein